MKKALLILPLLAIGCQAPITKIEVKDLQKSDSVIVKDLRPESERVHKIFSISVVSEAYGIAREGDAHTDPLPVRLLQHKAFEKLGGSAQPINLTVHHFVIYSNATAAFRTTAMAVAVNGIVVGSRKLPLTQVSLVDRQAFEALDKEEFKRGYYGQSENPSRASVVIVYIDADINGKRTFIRLLMPHKGESYASSTDLAVAINKAVESGVQSFIDAY